MKVLPARSELSSTVIGLMGAGTVILLLIVGTSIWLANSTADLSTEVTRVRQTRTLASQTLETVLDAETSQRGYLLTLSSRYLEPYNQARATLASDLAALDKLEAGNPALRGPLEELHDLTGKKMAELAKTIDLAQSGQVDQAIAEVRTDRGINDMDAIRKDFEGVIDNAEATVQADVAQLGTNATFLQWVTTVGGLVVIGFGMAAMWIVIQSIRASLEARKMVEGLNATLEDRVTRRTAALSRANEEIQRFAYIVSHDLRAPLVNIMGFTTELETNAGELKNFFEDETPQNRHAAREAAMMGVPEAVKFIRSSTGKMDRLINAILKLSREGKRELMPERVELNKVFETIAGSLQHQVEETQTTIDLSASLPAVTSDRLALEQIFSNLCDNALKYLQPGRPGHIAVTAETTRHSVIIAVKDNGRGIAQNDTERVFELFRRAGKQDKQGEGIGLAHVRALVRRLGGDITVVSQLGEGSEFRVLLPKILTTDTGTQAA
jgi:signal transduction histidine kinase